MLDRILEIKDMQAKVDERYAEKMGYDCGFNGNNSINSHFAIFSQPHFTKAWERGYARGKSDRREPQSHEVQPKEKS